MSDLADIARRGPLSGVLVIDLTRFMAGPYATQSLAQLGATVLKVEDPRGGDPVRTLSKHFDGGLSAHYATGNSDKCSVTLALDRPEGRELLLRLVERADVLVENFRPGTLDRLGLGLDVLTTRNENLIVCRISGFGQTGPWRDLPAYDIIAQAAGGGMSLTGEPGRVPAKMGIPVGDLAAGAFAAFGVVAALYDSKASGGGGCEVDVSMMDVQLSMLNYHAHFHWMSGETPQPEGDGHPNIVPYQSFETADGPLVIAVYGDRFWPGFCRAIERPDLLEHSHFATNAVRLVHRGEVVAVLARHLLTKPRAYWFDRLIAEGVPAAPLHSVPEALSSAQAQAREMVCVVAGPDGGEFKMLGNPVKMTTNSTTVRLPPALGADTERVLREFLDVDTATLKALRDDCVI